MSPQPCEVTARAATLWATIPRKARERILKNVFCAECGGSVEIIKFTGAERDGNLVLVANMHYVNVTAMHICQ
jgi:hypothetical protein